MNSGGRGKRETGRLGESAAAVYLQHSGYRLLERNWRCRTGEIDIVARHGDKLVFVEVRTRRAGGGFGTAAESVDTRKQRKVTAAAQVYLHMKGLHESPVRFDVIAITLIGDEVTELNHIEGAF